MRLAGMLLVAALVACSGGEDAPAEPDGDAGSGDAGAPPEPTAGVGGDGATGGAGGAAAGTGGAAGGSAGDAGVGGQPGALAGAGGAQQGGGAGRAGSSGSGGVATSGSGGAAGGASMAGTSGSGGEVTAGAGGSAGAPPCDYPNITCFGVCQEPGEDDGSCPPGRACSVTPGYCDDLVRLPPEPVPAPGCPGYVDYLVPKGTCLSARGEFKHQSSECDYVEDENPIDNCSTVTANDEDKAFRVSDGEIEVERLGLEDGRCPESC